MIFEINTTQALFSAVFTAPNVTFAHNGSEADGISFGIPTKTFGKLFKSVSSTDFLKS